MGSRTDNGLLLIAGVGALLFASGSDAVPVPVPVPPKTKPPKRKPGGGGFGGGGAQNVPRAPKLKVTTGPVPKVPIVIDVSEPPPTADQIRARFQREPTTSELKKRAAYEVDVAKLNKQLDDEQQKRSAAPTPQKALANSVAKAAKLASDAVAPKPTAAQATGSKIATALRSLSPVTKAKAQAPRPAPLRAPTSVSRTAAPAGTNLALAKQTAADVAAHIRKTGKKYTVKVVKDFQLRCGLKNDGLYGPVTASALRYWGANAPAALYKGVNAQYVPPT